jgi:hypothetical protein
MTNDTTLWTTLQRHLPRRRWIAIADIFLIVQRRTQLDDEDLERISSRSSTPRWKSNVLRILHSKQREGTIAGRKSQPD